MQNHVLSQDFGLHLIILLLYNLEDIAWKNEHIAWKISTHTLPHCFEKPENIFFPFSFHLLIWSVPLIRMVLELLSVVRWHVRH